MRFWLALFLLSCAKETRNPAQNWTFEDLSGQQIQLEKVWNQMPVLLGFLDIQDPESLRLAQPLYELDNQYGGVLAVFGVHPLREEEDGQKIAGVLIDEIEAFALGAGIKQWADLPKILQMRVLRVPEGAPLWALGKKGTATLLARGGEVVVREIAPDKLQETVLPYLQTWHEEQRFVFGNFGSPPRELQSDRNTIFLVWLPFVVLEVPWSEIREAIPEGWDLVVLIPAPGLRYTELPADLPVREVSASIVEQLLGTSDFLVPAVVLVRDGTIIFRASGLREPAHLRELFARLP